MKLNHTYLLAVIALFLSFYAAPVYSEESKTLDNVTSLAELASWLDENPPEALPLSGITGQRVLSQSLTKLRQDTNQLYNYLRRNGEIGAKWARVLNLDELRSTINQNSPDLEALEKIHRRFHSHQWGLEITEIRQVAKDLDNYIILRMNIADDVDISSGLKEATDRLKDVIKNSKQPDFKTTLEINEIINWLEVNQQAPEVCQAVRRLTGKYNCYAQISDNFVLKYLNRPVDQTQQVSEYIVGRPQSGTIHTVGETTGQFIPDPDKVNLSITLDGEASGTTYSQTRNVTVSSSTNNKIHAVKNIYFDGKKLTSPPAHSTVQVNSKITGISSPGGLVQSAATNRAYELKPQADAEAAYKARYRVESSMNRELDSLIKKANARLSQSSEVFVARGLYPSPFDCTTTEHSLTFSALISDGIPLIPQPIPTAPDKSDVFIAIHQSAIMESCKTMLGDLKANQRTFMAIAKSILPEDAYNEFAKNAEKKKNSEELSGYMYFNADYPVNVQFDNNTVTFDIRIDAFQGKDSSSIQSTPMNLTTAFKIDKVDKNGVRFVRIKEPEFIPRDFETNVRRLTTQEITLRNRLQREFKDSIPDSFLIKPRKLEALTDDSNPANSVKVTGTLQPVDAKVANGWLTINWQFQE